MVFKGKVQLLNFLRSIVRSISFLFWGIKKMCTSAWCRREPKISYIVYRFSKPYKNNSEYRNQFKLLLIGLVFPAYFTITQWKPCSYSQFKNAETHVCFLLLKKSFGTSDAKVMKVFTKIMRRKLERETLEKRNIFCHQESSGQVGWRKNPIFTSWQPI